VADNEKRRFVLEPLLIRLAYERGMDIECEYNADGTHFVARTVPRSTLRPEGKLHG
jgi:hypothetical protein